MASRFSGWSLVGQCAILLFALTFLRLGSMGAGEAGVRAMVRSTAQLSVVLFSAAFVASSLHALQARRAWVKWLRANRRYLGVSFALSHTVHLLFILWLARISQEFVDELNAAVVVGGGLGYVFVFAMAATSFDRTAAWLGPRRWRLLHKVGAYYIWFIFFQSYVPRAIVSPAYVPFTSLLLAVLGLRSWAWLKRKKR
jgi:hypothetical protein